MPEREDGQGSPNMLKSHFSIISVLSSNPFLLRSAESSYSSYFRGFWDYSEGFGVGVTQGLGVAQQLPHTWKGSDMTQNDTRELFSRLAKRSSWWWNKILELKKREIIGGGLGKSVWCKVQEADE